MQKYLFNRVLLIIPTVLGAGICAFFFLRFIPGDICLVRWVDYGQDLRPELLTYCRNELGLNDPLFSQFLRFITGVLTFDFGVSMWIGRPIVEELELRFSLSFQVAIMATTVSIIIALPLGVLSAVKQNT